MAVRPGIVLFRGVRAPASLKQQPTRSPTAHCDRLFRGVRAPASLKREEGPRVE